MSSGSTFQSFGAAQVKERSPSVAFGYFRVPYLKNTHKNPKFGRVKQIPIRELGWEFPDWDLSHFAKFGIFVGIL